MNGAAAGRARYPARAMGIWRLTAAACEMLLFKHAAEGITLAHAGTVARIMLQSRHAMLNRAGGPSAG